MDATVELLEYCVFCKKEFLCPSVIISWNTNPAFLLLQLGIDSKPMHSKIGVSDDSDLKKREGLI